MQIVIDINENEYLGIKNYPDAVTSYPVTLHLYEAVRSGTPLPKGHGILIDADALINNLNRDFLTSERELYYDVNPANALAEAFNIIEDTPTIIEADKGESEDKE